jgi:xanthine dehydrogenase accessory factor
VSEITDVLQAIESLSAKGERMALATIVAVRGSTYRRPGARLLVPEQGTPIGNISGGCLEGDVADMARVVMSEGTARLAGWDLTADDDAVWGLGLGCNGAIEVFIEPADQAAEVAHALRAALEEELQICVVTVLESEDDAVEHGSRIVVRPGGEPEGSLGAAGLDAEAIASARELLDAERSEVRTFTHGVRAFVEVLEPPLRLLVCGAGHDAIPLVRAARGIGWKPIVVDDRPGFLTEERFPDAAGFVSVETPEHVSKDATIDRRTHVVVMTHNFLRDKEYLRSLLDSDAGYIGMLGPSARTNRLLMELADEGVGITDADRERIHGPAGLDLGAEGPEEIAQAIVAEIVATRHDRAGGFLKARPGPIHDRPAPGTEAR